MEPEKLIEKLSQEQNESSKVVRIALAYAEFASLVKKMREAQKREWEIKSKQTCGKELDEHTEVVTKLESEVDEYLKKMEI